MIHQSVLTGMKAVFVGMDLQQQKALLRVLDGLTTSLEQIESEVTSLKKQISDLTDELTSAPHS